MKKFRYLRYRDDLTQNGIYDVLDQEVDGEHVSILIENDLGERKWYTVFGRITRNIIFEDATTEIRNNVIDGILK